MAVKKIKKVPPVKKVPAVKKAKIVDAPDLVKDFETGAVLNTSTDAYISSVKRRREKKVLRTKMLEVDKLGGVVEALLSRIGDLEKIIALAKSAGVL